MALWSAAVKKTVVEFGSWSCWTLSPTIYNLFFVATRGSIAFELLIWPERVRNGPPYVQVDMEKHVQVNLNKKKSPAWKISFVFLRRYCCFNIYPVKMFSSSISCHIHAETGKVATWHESWFIGFWFLIFHAEWVRMSNRSIIYFQFFDTNLHLCFLQDFAFCPKQNNPQTNCCAGPYMMTSVSGFEPVIVNWSMLIWTTNFQSI